MNFQHARRRCSRERSRPSAADEEAGGRPSTISAGASDEINEFLVGCAAAILARANGSACPLQVVTVSKVFKVDRPPPRPRGSFPLFTYRVGPPSVVRVSDAYLFRANQARRCHDRSRDGDARDDPKNAICRSVCPHPKSSTGIDHDSFTTSDRAFQRNVHVFGCRNVNSPRPLPAPINAKPSCASLGTPKNWIQGSQRARRE